MAKCPYYKHVRASCNNCKYAKRVRGPYLGDKGDVILTCDYAGMIVTPYDYCNDYEYSGGKK